MYNVLLTLRDAYANVVKRTGTAKKCECVYKCACECVRDQWTLIVPAGQSLVPVETLIHLLKVYIDIKVSSFSHIKPA